MERRRGSAYSYGRMLIDPEKALSLWGTSKYLAPAASPLRVDPWGECVLLIHNSLLLGRRLRSSILSSSRLVWIKNTHPCHPFEVLQGTPW